MLPVATCDKAAEKNTYFEVLPKCVGKLKVEGVFPKLRVVPCFGRNVLCTRELWCEVQIGQKSAQNQCESQTLGVFREAIQNPEG